MRMLWRSFLPAVLLVHAVAMADERPALKRQPRTGGIYVVAHRGVHDGIPENTLAAYQKAIDLGADFVEVDLRETRDAHIVSVHNSTVDAYTKDAEGPVKNFTLAELRAMDIGSRVGPEWANERIPTFEEILAMCKGKIGIYLDLKNAPAPKLLEMIRAHGMEQDVLWYAGAAQLRYVAEHCPECVPMPDPGLENMLPYVLKAQQPRVVASTWKNLSENFIKACHDAEALVIVDDGGPETWQHMLDWGVDGIQTDHVAALIDYLAERSKEKPECDMSGASSKP